MAEHKDPNKTPRRLFVCELGRMRSKTAAHIFGGEYAGVALDADRPVTRALLEWADQILLMENRHRNKIRRKYSGFSQKMRVLHIPDEFFFLQDELIDLLKQKL